MADNTAPRFLDEDRPQTERRAETTRRFALMVDPYLVVSVVALLAIGLLMVWSTTFFLSENATDYIFKQIRNMLGGGILAILLSLVDYRVLKRFAIPMMAVIIALLVLVLILPDSINKLYGAKRSLSDGGIQPSEPAKLIVIIYMAAWLSSKKSKLKNIMYGLLPFAMLVGVIGVLIILEPDISTAGLILVTLCVMFFLAGADLLQISIIGVVMIVLAVVVVSILPYAQERFRSWVLLIQDPVNAPAVHSQNVIIAFLNGGLSGVGLGGGYQKFYNLSVPHTDSIFAVIGEELGLLGAGVVVALFLIFMLRGFRVARNAPDSFGALVAAGVTTAIIMEALFNIAVMSAVIPFAGVPLPFISYGGSSLVTVMVGVGLIMSVSRVTARQATQERWTTRYSVNRDERSDAPVSRGNRRRDLPRVSRL